MLRINRQDFSSSHTELGASSKYFVLQEIANLVSTKDAVAGLKFKVKVYLISICRDTGEVLCLSFNPYINILASGKGNGQIKLYDEVTHQVRRGWLAGFYCPKVS